MLTFEPSTGASPTSLRPKFTRLRSSIDTAFIDPGKPWQNATNESFNDKFRDECLSLEWFRSRAEAKVLIQTWRRHYNEVRPHSSLGYMTPREFINSGAVLQ